MRFEIPTRVTAAAAGHRAELLFATISGAHLYGFPSPDSDWDLRGSHVLPAQEVLGLGRPEETITIERAEPGFELDLVTHDVAKFFRLMMKKNGYVLEQLYSPLIVSTTPAHDELKYIAQGCVTRHHVHHYIGFARNQRDLYLKHEPRRAKPLLYVYRVLLTGIHLMRTGAIEANLVHLLDEYPVPGVDELIDLKTHGTERGTISLDRASRHDGQLDALFSRLDHAGQVSTLRDAPTAGGALSDLLVRLRLATLR